jgi:hypothetical protein
MTEIFEMLDPYLSIVVKSLVILLNIILIFKSITFIPILLFNIIISGVLNILGLSDYDIITSFFREIQNIMQNVFNCDSFLGGDATLGTIIGVGILGPIYNVIKWIKNKITGG